MKAQTSYYIGKTNNTILQKYGVENVFQLESIKEKIRQTNLKNTGYEYPSQCPEIREKAKETWIKNLGVDNPLKNKEIREKSMKTLIDQSHGTGINTSKQQEFIWLEIGGELNYKISSFHTDIAFPNELIVVEYDGGGHFLYKDINHESDDYFKELEQKREKILFDSNWKIIRIVDRKSHARNFKQVLYNVKENVDYAKNILKNSDCQKVIINYDDKKIYYDNKEESILC
jgi:very-short-patch-repair endonuclease